MPTRLAVPAVVAGPGWPRFDPLPRGELAALQLSSGVHICPSEREGYGLYLAEGRAAGALVVATDHAPMNEQVRQCRGAAAVLCAALAPDSSARKPAWAAKTRAPTDRPSFFQVNPTTGVLIRPDRVFSQPGPPRPALGRFGNISASVSADVRGPRCCALWRLRGCRPPLLWFVHTACTRWAESCGCLGPAPRTSLGCSAARRASARRWSACWRCRCSSGPRWAQPRAPRSSTSAPGCWRRWRAFGA